MNRDLVEVLKLTFGHDLRLKVGGDSEGVQCFVFSRQSMSLESWIYERGHLS